MILFRKQAQQKFSDNRCELNVVCVRVWVCFLCRTPVKILQVALPVFSPFPGSATVAAAATVGFRMRWLARLKPRGEQEGVYLLLAWKGWVPWHGFWRQVIVAIGSVEEGLSALAVPRERGVKHQPGGRAGLRVQRAPTWGRAIFHIEAVKERRDSLVTWEPRRTVCIHREFPAPRARLFRQSIADGCNPSHFVRRKRNSTNFTHYPGLLLINRNPTFGPKSNTHDLSAVWPIVTNSEWETGEKKKNLVANEQLQRGHLAQPEVPDEDITRVNLPSWKISSSHKYQPH